MWLKYAAFPLFFIVILLATFENKSGQMAKKSGQIEIFSEVNVEKF